MSKIGIFGEFLYFIKKEKKWWIIPLVVLIGLLALILIFGQAVAPFVPFLYPAA
jgi:hypothetical protein